MICCTVMSVGPGTLCPGPHISPSRGKLSGPKLEHGRRDSSATPSSEPLLRTDRGPRGARRSLGRAAVLDGAAYATGRQHLALGWPTDGCLLTELLGLPSRGSCGNGEQSGLHRSPGYIVNQEQSPKSCGLSDPNVPLAGSPATLSLYFPYLRW